VTILLTVYWCVSSESTRVFYHPVAVHSTVPLWLRIRCNLKGLIKKLPALTQARHVGTRFTYPTWMEGWVDLCHRLHTEMVYPPTDGHPSRYWPNTAGEFSSLPCWKCKKICSLMATCSDSRIENSKNHKKGDITHHHIAWVPMCCWIISHFNDFCCVRCMSQSHCTSPTFDR